MYLFFFIVKALLKWFGIVSLITVTSVINNSYEQLMPFSNAVPFSELISDGHFKSSENRTINTANQTNKPANQYNLLANRAPYMIKRINHTVNITYWSIRPKFNSSVVRLTGTTAIPLNT